MASGSLTDVKRVREFSRFSEIIRRSLIKTRENAPICKTLKVERLVKCMRIKAGEYIVGFFRTQMWAWAASRKARWG